MAKDPAFLFYSQAWLEGTAEMTLEEKGMYIDLLANQHQKGSLPTEPKRLCKLARCGEDEFLKIWPDISFKFKQNGDGRLVNRRLTEVVTERLERGHKNKIISALAVAVKQSKMPVEIKNEAKKGFNVLSFFTIPEPKVTEAVTEWFTERLASLTNTNKDTNTNIYNSNYLAPEMFKIFKTHNPKYPSDKDKDFVSCLQLAYKIAESKGWNKSDIVTTKKKDVLEAWEKIVLFTASDKWFSTRALYDLNNEWQRLIQSMNGKFSGTAKLTTEVATSVKKESDVDFNKYVKNKS